MQDIEDLTQKIYRELEMIEGISKTSAFFIEENTPESQKIIFTFASFFAYIQKRSKIIEQLLNTLEDRAIKKQQ